MGRPGGYSTAISPVRAAHTLLSRRERDRCARRTVTDPAGQVCYASCCTARAPAADLDVVFRAIMRLSLRCAGSRRDRHLRRRLRRSPHHLRRRLAGASAKDGRPAHARGQGPLQPQRRAPRAELSGAVRSGGRGAHRRPRRLVRRRRAAAAGPGARRRRGLGRGRAGPRRADPAYGSSVREPLRRGARPCRRRPAAARPLLAAGVGPADGRVRGARRRPLEPGAAPGAGPDRYGRRRAARAGQPALPLRPRLSGGLGAGGVGARAGGARKTN
jgi:hypothetical protein